MHSGEGYEAQLVCIVHGEPPPEVSKMKILLPAQKVENLTLAKILRLNF